MLARIRFGFFVAIAAFSSLALNGLNGSERRQLLPDSISNKIKNSKTETGRISGLIDAGDYLTKSGKYQDGIIYADSAITGANRLGDQKILADAFNLKGMVFDYEGKMADAIEFYLKALTIREKLGSKIDIGRSLNNLGSAYYFIQSLAKAEEYFERARAIYDKTNFLKERAAVYSNLGSVLQQIGVTMNGKPGQIEKFTKSLTYHKLGKSLYEQINNESGLGLSYNNIAVLLISLKQYDSSLIYTYKSLKIRKKLNDEYGISLCYSNMAQLFLETKRLDSAFHYAKLSYSINNKNQSREGLRSDLLALSEIEAQRGNYKSALEKYKAYVTISDSLVNQESRERIANFFVEFEFEKKLYQDSLKLAEEKKREELKQQLEENEIERSKNIQYSGIVIFLLIVMGGAFFLGKVHLPVIWLEGFIFFSALLIFEFLYLVLDPVIEAISGGMPIYKFIINMLLAVIVFYGHSFFESLMKGKLIREKEKL